MTANYIVVFCSKQVQPHNTASPSPSLGHAQLCRTNVVVTSFSLKGTLVGQVIMTLEGESICGLGGDQV